MHKFGIIGGGFAGTMTAVQLIENASTAFELFVFNEDETFNTGIAYSPYSKLHLLNVITSKMSAYPDRPNHFLDWVMSNTDYIHQDESIVANAFMPRYVYGNYLMDIWKDAEYLAKSKHIKISIIHCQVENFKSSQNENKIEILTEDGKSYLVDSCVLTTGNLLPRNPLIPNKDFFKSTRYYQNPWKIESVQNTNKENDILIIGNGLTMVDTVIGLREHGFKGNIYSISPNGFNILPHRHNGMKYTKLAEEIKDNMTLSEIVKLVMKHVKDVRSLGVSAEPIIDSLRPYTQKIWRQLSDREKEIFMSRLRHLWGVARHRIPLQIHDRIQQMRIENKLHIYAGRLLDMNKSGMRLSAQFFNKKSKEVETIQIDRVINCTGPETKLSNLESGLLRNLYHQGIITQDKLNLGLNARLDTFQLIDKDGHCASNLYTIGGNLKGLLWESTAVNELRTQAEQLAKQLIEKIPILNTAI